MANHSDTVSSMSVSSSQRYFQNNGSSVSSAPVMGTNSTCVIGMACRVPGASTPSKLWENIAQKIDLQTKMPSDRFNVDAWYHPDGAHKGTTNARFGYFLEQDISLFDAGFFHISGREAEAMDPQQRLLLEVVYEALENAGITLDEIKGSQTSVFCGTFTNDYMSAGTKDSVYYPKYTVTGTGNSILSNRISYFYDLHGPSATIDTACSSSLVGLHLGSQSLHTGEADTAIIVGSALHYDPRVYVEMTDLGMLSTDGRCRHGDVKGSGYVRGEGITALVLRRQQQALLQGNRIRAVIRGTGVNHDGSKQGITLPSDIAQADLIRRVYHTAGLSPLETQYVECHGTGTKAGDPRELRGLGLVFAQGRKDPLWVGSVKTNIGHLEGASGLAGVIKTIMALENRKIPPNMHFETPNPEVDFANWNLKIPTEMVDWKSDGIRRASVNSFGYGGTNAHIIIEESIESHQLDHTIVPQQVRDMTKSRPYLFPLSSHSGRAGKLLANKFIDYLEKQKDTNLSQFARSLSYRRTMHNMRSFAVGSSTDEVISNLRDPLPSAHWNSKMDQKPRLGFVFTGQGAQWFAMGRQLLENSPFFLQTLQRCDKVLKKLLDGPTWSIVEELLKTKESSRLGETEFSQPICTALQIAIVDLIKQWAISPSAVVGHSSGEVAAAYSAGFLNLENAMVTAYYRGLHMGNGAKAVSSVKGAMMAVGLSEAETIVELEKYKGRLTIAAMNSPTSFTVSGDEDAIVELQAQLSVRKIFARRLQVSQAFHSHHMNPLAPAYEEALRKHPGFVSNEPSTLMFSSVTARVAEAEKMDAKYFTANMTGTVRFSDALIGIVLDEEDKQNIDVLIEIGPHPALKGPSKQTLDTLKMKIPYIGSLDRSQPAMEALLSMAGQLFAFGYPVDLLAVNQDGFYDNRGQIQYPAALEPLRDMPTYAWDQERYWSETRIIKDNRLRRSNHEILGAPIPGCLLNRPRYRNHLRVAEMPWLADHAIAGKVVFPAAGYINMAIEAAARLELGAQPIKQFHLRDISIKSALLVSNSDLGTEVLLELQPVRDSARSNSSRWYDFSIFSFDEAERCHEHCTGIVSIEHESLDNAPNLNILNSSKVPKSHRTVMAEKYYDKINKIGLQYGPKFRLLTGVLESGPGFATASIQWRPELFSALSNDISIIHPALLDASFHPLFAAIEAQVGSSLSEPFVPTFIESLKVSGAISKHKLNINGFLGDVIAEACMHGPRIAMTSVKLVNNDALLVDIQGLELTSLGSDVAADDAKRSLFFGDKWKPVFDLLGTYASNLDDPSMSHLLDIHAHQYPNAKILHLSSSIESTYGLLSTLGGINGIRRRFSSMSIQPEQNVSSSVFEPLIAEFDGRVVIETAAEEKFELIVVDSETCSKMVSKVTEGGVVIMPSHFIGTIDGMLKVCTVGSASIWRLPLRSMKRYSPLTIIMPDIHSKEAEAVASFIQSQYRPTISRRTLSSLCGVTDLEGDILVLASLGNDLFFSGSDRDRVEFEAAKTLRRCGSANIVWLTQGGLMDAPHPEHSIILGLTRVIRSENENLRLVLFDISVGAEASKTAKLAYQLIRQSTSEDEICERNGVLYSCRCEANDALNARIPNGYNHEPQLQTLRQEGRPLTLQITQPGLLHSLSFIEDLDIMYEQLKSNEIEILVEATTVESQDVATSTGSLLRQRARLGGACAGVVLHVGAEVSENEFRPGDRVVAWMPGQGAHKTICRNPARLCCKIPDQLSFPSAATIPTSMLTAYFALTVSARLRSREIILIMSAASSIGQMAVQIALMLGTTVLAHVGHEDEVTFLGSTFNLDTNQIFISETNNLATKVMELTGSSGADVIFNPSSTQSFLDLSKCIAPFGRYVELEQSDIQQKTKIGMDLFKHSISFSSIDMFTLYEKNDSLGSKLLYECCQLVLKGVLKPLPNIIQVPFAEAERAYRHTLQERHISQAVLVPEKEEQVMVHPKLFGTRPLFNPEKTYLLVGGFGGLGRSLSEWLFRMGARKLAFLSRSGDKSQGAKETVQWLRTHGVTVSIFRADVTDFDVVKTCIDGIGQSLAGVFQAAMVLQDSQLDTMTFSQWQNALLPKVRGTYNLHRATLNSKLEVFVCFSSVSAVVGAKGQANYAAANSYLDALCRYRRSQGLVASTMNVGMMTGIGAVSENDALRVIMERIGYDGVSEDELFAQIEYAVTCDQHKVNQPGEFQAHQTITGVNLSKDNYYWVNKPYFRNIYRNHDFAASTAVTNPKNDVLSLLQTASKLEDKEEILTSAFIDKVSSILSVDKESIQPLRGLADYGLDSIVAVEIRKWFFKSVQVELAIFDVLGSKSIQALIQKALSLLVTESPQVPVERQSKRADPPPMGIMSTAIANSIVSKPHSIPRHKLEDIPMSTFQRRLWFAHNMAEDTTFLHLPVIKRIKGQPNLAILRETLTELKKRNEILRTAYFEGDEFAQQQVLDDWSIELPFIDLSLQEEPEATMQNHVQRMKGEPMDIEEGQVFRMALFKLDVANYALVGVYHHIAVDRGCTKIVLEQMVAIYDAIHSSADLKTIPAPTVRYSDFAVWHSEHLQSVNMQKHINFWKSQFSQPMKPCTLLPFARRQRPQEADFRRQIHRETLRLSMLNRMKRVSARMGATPAQFLMAAFRSFLYRYTEEEDMTIHMIDGNRPHPDVSDIVGFFVNIVPIRLSIQSDNTFDAVLRGVKDSVLTALEHSSVPFDAIVDRVGMKRDPAFFPLGQVAFNYQMHGTMPIYPTQDFEFTDIEGEDIPSACELNLEIIEDPSQGLKFRLESSSTLYGSNHMERFLDNFVEFLNSIIKDHRQPISEISICGSKELTHLKTGFFNMKTVANAWGPQSVVDKLIEAANKFPSVTAIETSDGESISYERLLNNANYVSGALLRSGCHPRDIVAIYSEPGIPAITAMIGALLSRCGFVALDPEFATDRLAFMVTDSGAKIILTSDHLQPQAVEIVTKVKSFVQAMPISAATLEMECSALLDAEGNDPFYMIYTSGSTGKPKGVILTQANTQQMLSTMHKDYSFSHKDHFFHQSSICFDLSIVQIFSALTCGARTCVALASIRKDPQALASYMKSCAVTVSYFTPTQYSLLIEHARQSLVECNTYRIAFFAGERLPVRVAKAFYDLQTPAVAYNTWSPSELVVQTTIAKVTYPCDEHVNIPIGYPLDNTRHYILDVKGQPLPEGFIGEIVVGGAQVSNGYRNRPDINRRSFIKDPFCSIADHALGWTRMFRTGDQGRFLADGCLEFHGRIAGDKQIKLRGYRIDLGEIEQRLFVEANKDPACPGVIDISVVAREISPNADSELSGDTRQIIAFVVPRIELNATTRGVFASGLNRVGEKHLNHYMLPNGYQFVDCLPTTIGGKVDRQKLLYAELTLTFPSTAKSIGGPHTGNQTEADGEQILKIAELFREVLKLPETLDIPPDSNFFELGGQSILMLRLQAKIKKSTKKALSLNSMFKSASPRGIATLLQDATAKRAPKQTSKKVEEAEETVDWDSEVILDTGYWSSKAESFIEKPRSQYTSILFTGVETFTGINTLNTLLTDSKYTTIHVIGSQRVIGMEDIETMFEQHLMFNAKISAETLQSRLICIPGCLEDAYFGLTESQFQQLGHDIDAIWHLGGAISLLQTYPDMKRANVDPIKHIVELAALGRHRTEIHYLSTWSVPHLQGWTTSERRDGKRSVTQEVAADYMKPEPSSRFGYFKSRWVAEMLLLHAAERGFRVNIIRASAVTANSVTNVTEGKDDFIRRMILTMMSIGAVFDNKLLAEADVPFAVDFIPVNYLAKCLHALLCLDLTTPVQDAVNPTACILHVTNPQPIPFTSLPNRSTRSTTDSKVRKIPLEDWLALALDSDSSPGAKLRWGVLNDYVSNGHNMFALDRTKTKQLLELAGLQDEDCPPIDDKFLNTLIAQDEQQHWK